MSDASQGPGWWQASDGKWYPPEQHPDHVGAAAPPPTQPPTQPFAALPTQPPYAPPPTQPPYAAPAPPPPGAPGGGRRAPLLVAIGAVAVVVIGAVAFLAFRGDSSGSTASFCDDAKKAAADSAGQDATNDPAKLAQAVAAFDRLAKESPAEIKDDMKTIDDFLHKLQDAIKQSSKGSDQFGSVLSVFATVDQRKLEAAGANVDRFAKDKCGVDLSFDSTSSGSSFDSAFSDLSDFSNFASEFSQFSDFSQSLSGLSDFATEFSSLFSSDLFSTSS